ncbi:MAG: GNAT family N-acetyltransferase [Bacteroidetes bacterium]|nr:MAG: GNAT family N-acetyltransferase [Bacteroidota bacterium]
MEVRCRVANLNDLGKMQHLFVETIKSTCRNDYNQEQIDAWITSVKNVERWKSFLDTQFVLIVERDEEMLGFGSLENGNYLDFLYVHKAFLRQGIASLIYEKLKAESLKRGFESLSSDVSKTARPFFEAKGFKVIRENINLVNGVEIRNYRMSQA